MITFLGAEEFPSNFCWISPFQTETIPQKKYLGNLGRGQRKGKKMLEALETQKKHITTTKTYKNYPKNCVNNVFKQKTSWKPLKFQNIPLTKPSWILNKMLEPKKSHKNPTGKKHTFWETLYRDMSFFLPNKKKNVCHLLPTGRRKIGWLTTRLAIALKACTVDRASGLLWNPSLKLTYL